jgi:hypothetical protein
MVRRYGVPPRYRDLGDETQVSFGMKEEGKQLTSEPFANTIGAS